jgi:Protein of unknown function (DUF2510)
VAESPRDAGWYQRPGKPHVKHYFDGESWTENVAPKSVPADAPVTAGAGIEPAGPAEFLILGIALAVIGGALAAGGANGDNELVLFLGYVVSAVGWLVCLVGVVAVGVRRGIRLADFDRKMRGD